MLDPSLWSAAYNKGRVIFSPSAPEEAPGDLQTSEVGHFRLLRSSPCDLAMLLASGPRQPGVEPGLLVSLSSLHLGLEMGVTPAGACGLGGSYLHVQ